MRCEYRPGMVPDAAPCGRPARWQYLGLGERRAYCDEHAERARRLVRLYPRLCRVEPLTVSEEVGP